MIHAAAGGFSYAVRNRLIGMPVSNDTPWSFHEYAIPAGEPVTVRMYWQAQNTSGRWEDCGPTHVMLTPEAGQDYEAFMQFRRGVCQGAEVRKLVKGPDGIVTTTPAPLNGLPFRYCRSSLQRLNQLDGKQLPVLWQRPKRCQQANFIDGVVGTLSRRRDQLASLKA